MSGAQWTSPGRIVTGLVSAAVIAAALASATGSQRAQSLGLTQHGALITAQDAGAADAVAAVAVSPGTVGQVLTVGDAGLPVWRTAATAYTDPLTTNGDLVIRAGGATTRLGTLGAPDGGVLTVTNGAPAWAAASSGGSGVTMVYAADCFAEAGSESASISGTGSTSTFTITASSTSRTYGSGGATAARVVCPIPAGTREIEVELQTTAVSGMTTGGFRYLTMALRNVRDGNAPTVLWGVSVNDGGSGGLYANNLMGGGNAAGAFSTSLSVAPTAADRWYRAVYKPREIFLSASSGSGSAGARPTTWAAPAAAIPLQTSGSSVVVPDLGSATALAIVLQSFGTGGATSITARVAIRVVPQ